MPSHGTLPLECCIPLKCCSTASQHCTTASGLQQHCLWTAAALLLDRDTAFPMGQHCPQLVAALTSHGSGSAFTMWQHCLQTVVPLPLQRCMPLECCSTASQHCSIASGLQRHCISVEAALPAVGGSTPKTPTGHPYPSPAQAGPEGLGCIRRCVGVGGVVSPPNPHGASLSLPGPGRTGGTRVYPPLCGGGWCGAPS